MNIELFAIPLPAGLLALDVAVTVAVLRSHSRRAAGARGNPVASPATSA